TYLETYADHLGRKVTKSSPLTPQTTRKRLYFSDFKERLVHFNGTVVFFVVVPYSIPNTCRAQLLNSATDSLGNNKPIQKKWSHPLIPISDGRVDFPLKDIGDKDY
ncbi:MAG: hypothetical protein IJQ89_01545, partial [Bacteroidales bacterium]|nr:hypothetical protein [Bacteroidales bacterium]